jgi:hypothetical protein
MGVGGKLVGVWVWNSGAWQSRALDETYIPQLNIGTGTYGELSGVRLVSESVTANKLSATEIWANEAWLGVLRTGIIDTGMITSDFAESLTLQNNNFIQLMVNASTDNRDLIELTRSDLSTQTQRVVDAQQAANDAATAAGQAQSKADSAYDVANNAATEINKMQVWFRVDGDGAHVGRTGTDFTANVEPGEFNIKQGSAKRTWWTDNKMVVPVLEATDQITIAKHAFEPYPAAPATATGTIIRRLAN